MSPTPDSHELMQSSTPPARWGAAPFFAAALLLIVYLLGAARFNFLCDDAFIAFRYAKNLAQGHGLRFNLSEVPPVEGFSNFGWVLIMSGVEALRLDPAVCSRGLSVSCGMVLTLLLFRYVRRRIGLALFPAFLATLFFVTLPPVAVWSTSGLATMPFALLVFVAFEILTGDADRRRAWSAALAGLAIVLLRTEGIAWALVLAAVAATNRALQGRRDLPRTLGPFLLAVLVGFAAYEAFRIAYFHDWVSNTAHVKIGFTPFAMLRGLNYAASFGLTVLSAGVIMLASIGPIRSPRGGPARAAAIMLAATFCAAVLVSGDFMPFFRLFLVGLPFLTILLACTLKALWSRRPVGRPAALVLAAACIALSIPPALGRNPFPRPWRENFRFRFAFFRAEVANFPSSEYRVWDRSKANCQYWMRLGRALRAMGKPSDSLVKGGIGATAYYSDMHLYDLAGLVDREVARRPPAVLRHSPGHDKVVALSHFQKSHPTYAYADLAVRGAGLAQELTALHALYFDRPQDRQMGEDYAPYVVPLRPENGFEPNEVLVLGKRKRP